jgi:hypothetical protein
MPLRVPLAFGFAVPGLSATVLMTLALLAETAFDSAGAAAISSYSEAAQTCMPRLSASVRSVAVVRSRDPEANACFSGSSLLSASV